MTREQDVKKVSYLHHEESCNIFWSEEGGWRSFQNLRHVISV